jgi:DNA-binding protein Fis
VYSPLQPFGAYVDELLAAARRDEVSDAHARVLEMAERELFARAIQQAQGNQARAARWLGISRITMKAKLVQFGLHPAQDVPAKEADGLEHSRRKVSPP